jgi:hypothetical protein
MIKLLILLSMFGLFLTSPALAASPPTTNDQLFKKVCDANPTSSVCQDVAKQNQDPNNNPANHMIHVVADIFAILTGVAALVFIIVSAFKFVTSNGNADKVKEARATLLAAVIGLAIIALAGRNSS